MASDGDGDGDGVVGLLRSHGCIDQVHFAYHHHHHYHQSPSNLLIIYLLSSLVLDTRAHEPSHAGPPSRFWNLARDTIFPLFSCRRNTTKEQGETRRTNRTEHLSEISRALSYYPSRALTQDDERKQRRHAARLLTPPGGSGAASLPPLPSECHLQGSPFATRSSHELVHR